MWWWFNLPGKLELHERYQLYNQHDKGQWLYINKWRIVAIKWDSDGFQYYN
jgi:hypothetical protein